MKEFVKKCREWQKNNQDWELICDIEDDAQYWQQWNELPRNERMSWIGRYRKAAKEAFEDFATKRPKVKMMVLDKNMEKHNPLDWPKGDAMTIYRTKINGVSVVER